MPPSQYLELAYGRRDMDDINDYTIDYNYKVCRCRFPKEVSGCVLDPVLNSTFSTDTFVAYLGARQNVGPNFFVMKLLGFAAVFLWVNVSLGMYQILFIIHVEIVLC